jgi:hypothetical protein
VIYEVKNPWFGWVSDPMPLIKSLVGFSKSLKNNYPKKKKEKKIEE